MTLEEFLSRGHRWPSNSYVDEPGFKSLYVRLSMRRIHGASYQAIDLANAEAVTPGAGAFTKLIYTIMDKYPHLGIFAESVLNERLRGKLGRMGFEYVGPHLDSPNYFLFPLTSGRDPSTIARLARKRLRRYSNYISYAEKHPGQRRVNIEETKQYFALWKGIETKKYLWECLNYEEKNGVIDALEDEMK